jgi:cation diffusion facilitator family transporter
VEPDVQRTLVRFMLLSIATACVTIALKVAAAAITGSVGFLSDAIESGVNLAAAVIALWALKVAVRPPDLEHHFGHGKAEYLSAAFEGSMILVASVAIIWTAVQRLRDPQPLDQPGLGLALSTAASLLNLGVGLLLVRSGKAHRSITLVADGRHLLTDVVTSAGVLVGIALVAIFDWPVLDPLVALIVGINVLWTGYRLLRRSVSGILDAALPDADQTALRAVLDRCRQVEGIDFHALRTREAGRQRFVYMHVLVPDEWSVKHAHDVTERVKREIAAVLPGVVTFAHMEPIDDPGSYDDELED